MSKIKLHIMLLIFLFGALLQGCSSFKQFSPETVISNALETEEASLSYYGELTMTSKGIEDLEDVLIREWRQGKSQRVEFDLPEGLLLLVTDGETMYIDDENEEYAYYSNDDVFHELMMDPKEELDMVLDMVEDTHDMKTIGEEKIAGRDTLHIRLTKQKGKKSLFGEQELWIDKENWMVLKMISTSGNLRQEISYDNIDFNAEIDQSVFEFKPSKNKELKNMDELDTGVTEEIELEDLPEKLEQAVLYLPDNQEHEISNITLMEIGPEPAYKDVTIDYKQDDLPLLTLTIIAQQEDEDSDELDELESMMEDVIEKDVIRDQKAELMEFDQSRTISWNEGGLRYSIEIIDPKVSWEQIKRWALTMKEAM